MNGGVVDGGGGAVLQQSRHYCVGGTGEIDFGRWGGGERCLGGGLGAGSGTRVRLSYWGVSERVDRLHPTLRSLKKEILYNHRPHAC